MERTKRTLKELKITAGEELAAIPLWGDKLEDEIVAVDDDMDRIRKCFVEIDQEQLDKTRKDQMDFEKELFERNLQYTKELESLQVTNANENKSNAGNENSKQQGAFAKLLKLTITKFYGTNLD